MSSDPYDLEGAGYTLGTTHFAIDDGLAPGLWQIIEGHEFILKRSLALSRETIIDAMDQAPRAEDGLLRVRVAPNLRSEIGEIIASIGHEPPDKPKSLMFSGTLTLHEDNGHPLIGGLDVLTQIDGAFGRGEPLVEVFLGVEDEPAKTAAGIADVDEGWAGTDVTPGDLPRIAVGGFDLLADLQSLGLDGRQVELVVRAVRREEPFYIEVDPRLRDDTWQVPDDRWSRKERTELLTGEKLAELATAGAPSIIVAFSMHEVVQAAIESYHLVEREQRKVFRELEVVPIMAARTGVLSAPAVTATLPALPPRFGISGIETVEELAAAQRGLDAYREIEAALTTLATADVIDGDVRYFYGGPGDGLSFRYCSHYGPGEWGCDYQPLRQGGLTTASLAEMLANGGQHFGFSRDLVVNAMVLLIAGGKVARERDIVAWAKSTLGNDFAG